MGKYSFVMLNMWQVLEPINPGLYVFKTKISVTSRIR